MVGTDITEQNAIGATYEGDAALTVSFAQAKVDVTFDNITSNVFTENRPGDMAWRDIPLVRGEFRSDTRAVERDGIGRKEMTGSMIEGRFYGARHEEAGGIFETPQILGAFGAKR